MGTCLRQGDLFYSAGLHRDHVLATANTGKIGRGFGRNADEWTRRVERSEEEIPGSKLNMYSYIKTVLKGERLSSVFSPDGTLISASAAPHCGVSKCKASLVKALYAMFGTHLDKLAHSRGGPSTLHLQF